MRTLGINTREDPLDPGAETAVEQQHGRTRGARNREGFYRWTSRRGRFAGVFFGGSLTPLALVPADVSSDSYPVTAMSSRQRRSASRSRTRAGEEQWADFADHVLEIAREIQIRGYTSPEAVSLTPSEGAVMRHLFRHPDALPSEVALATGLQRSNLSAVLRGLEGKGLIERVADPEDGRWVRIHPTSKAIRNYEIVRREWGAAVAAAADDDPAVTTVLPLLAKVRAGLGRLRQADGTR